MTKNERKMLDDLNDLLENDDLEGFEADFVRSNAPKSDNYELSEKQSTCLERMWNKHVGED